MKNLKATCLLLFFLPFFCQAQTSQPQNTTAGSTSTHSSDSVVRGISFAYFKQTVNDSAWSLPKKERWRKVTDSAWTLWKKEQWKKLEELFTTPDTLNYGWPPDSGAMSLTIVTLDSGLMVDRYGGYYINGVFHDTGKFVCIKGEPFENRALEKSSLKKPYRLYKIIKAIPMVKSGLIIPWFNEPGFGTQFQLSHDIDYLKQNKYIIEISNKPPPN